MSFFFRHIPTAEANFSVQSTAEAADEDTLLVSQDIWDALCFSDESRGLVSIKSKRQYPTKSLSDHPSALTCWAIRAPTVRISLQLHIPSFIEVKVSEIAVPPAWLVTYPTIFKPFQMSLDGSYKSVILSVVENITLTEVVLTAKHEDAYKAASVHGAAFENWFFESHVIIRDGENVFIPPSIFSCSPSAQPPSSLFGYTVSLALPYKQGVAQRGSTRFIVMSYSDSSGVSDKADSRGSHESLEINESFLISAVLPSPEPLSQANESGEDIARLCV
ncbi:hypothetical protein J3R82DRAFT_5541 [Butyriboletus roseoflavus]|nr:hypothetical protein J3R82DRAFT_5541 [Butyriboletus roseoflavus]